MISKLLNLLKINKNNLKEYEKYEYKSEDICFLTKFYRSFWNKCQEFIPSFIHPNIITLCGLLSMVVSYNLKNNIYGNYYTAIGIFLYMTFDSIDGIHARKTSQCSVIGEYIDHIIDLINLGMIVDIICDSIGFNNINAKNLIAVTSSIVFIYPHFESLTSGIIKFKNLTDVSGLLTLSILTLLFHLKLPNLIFLNKSILILAFFIFIYFLTNIYYDTNLLLIYNKFIITSYYLLKFIVLLIFPVSSIYNITLVDILLLQMIINYKIFKIDIDEKILCLPLLFLINNYMTNIFVIIITFYNIFKISKELKINLFYNQNKIKVYCCGVFDLCHLGHMILFENIVKSFDEPIELIVGIHSDEECVSYKREPVINEDFRAETIKYCKYVDTVIKNVPLIVTEEFIKENNIDCVIIGEEYKGTKDSIWYGDAMKMKIEKYIPRYEKLSTSDIINKIKNN